MKLPLNERALNGATELAYAAAALIQHTNGEHDIDSKAVRGLAVLLAGEATKLITPAVTACLTCDQIDAGQTGEYPCKGCGVPTLHDGAEAEPHSVSCRFEHFLSYSGLHSEPDDVKAKLRQAFEAAL